MLHYYLNTCFLSVSRPYSSPLNSSLTPQTSLVATANDGFTLYNGRITKYGKVAVIEINITKIPSGKTGWQKICTLPFTVSNPQDFNAWINTSTGSTPIVRDGYCYDNIIQVFFGSEDAGKKLRFAVTAITK